MLPSLPLQELKAWERDLIIAFFTSDYCPTCEEVESSWYTFKRMHKGEAAFVTFKLTDDTKEIFKKLGVSWIPAVVFYDDEEREVKRVEGLFSILDLEKALRAVLRKREALQAK